MEKTRLGHVFQLWQISVRNENLPTGKSLFQSILKGVYTTPTRSSAFMHSGEPVKAKDRGNVV